MPSIRVYERTHVPEGGLQRFADINQAGDVLRPGSVVCLTDNTADELLVVAKEGSSGWRLHVKLTGWSAREHNGYSTYAHDYLVESMAVEALWLVVRDGGSIGFSSLAAGGRMLHAADSTTGNLSLSTRTPINWGANETWERLRGEVGGTKLVSARWKDRLLRYMPLLCTCLPTAELARAEAFWGQQFFAVKEELRRQLEFAHDSDSRGMETLKAAQRQYVQAAQRVEELEELLQHGDSRAPGRPSVAADDTHEESAAAQQQQQAQLSAMQQQHLAEVQHLQAQLAALESELQAAHNREQPGVESALAQLQAKLQAKDQENQRLLQDRHRLDVALFTIKNMTVALRQCSPTSSGDSQGNAVTPQPAAQGLALRSGDFVIPAELTSLLADDDAGPEPSVEAALHWLEGQGGLPLPQDPHVHPRQQQKLMISFRQAAGQPQQRVEEEESELYEDDAVQLSLGGCRLIKYNGSNCMDEAALSRILDQPVSQRQQHQARVYKSLASAPASPATATEASPNGRNAGGWAAGSLSLPSSAVKVLEPSAAINDMVRSSPGAANALAGLFADRMVVRASLQLPTKSSDAVNQLRRSAPVTQLAKPRSSFLQRSPLPDVY